MNRLTPNTLIYDRDCELCCWAQGIVARLDHRRSIQYLAFQDPQFEDHFPNLSRDDPRGGWPHGEAPEAMLFIDHRGEVQQGMDAFRKLLPNLTGGRILAVAFYLPGVPWLAARLYGWLARNRYRLFGPARWP